MQAANLTIARSQADACETELEETLADVLAILRIQGVLRVKRDAFVEERPLDALALSIVVQAAGNVRRAWQTGRRVRTENREAARRRAAIERLKASDTLFRKLMKEPGVALAEAKFTAEGCRRVIELWRCLGDSLAAKEGWGADETKLARALSGSAETAMRTTRERIRLERALDTDRQRPMREMVATVDRVMAHYCERLVQSLDRLDQGERNLHEVVLESVQDKSFELMSMIGFEDREAILRFRDRFHDANSGKLQWAATRAYVAGRIREWHAKWIELERRTSVESEEDQADAFGLAEMRKAEWARKGLSAAIADFQKTLALAKSIGLTDSLAPKPPKPSRTAEASLTMQVEKSSLNAFDACDRPVDRDIRNRRDTASRTVRVQRSRPADATPAANSKLPRDASGRFAPGAACTQPRGPGGRFVRAGSNMPAGPDAEETTIRTSLRPTASGWQALLAITPNVAGRDQASRQGGSFAMKGEHDDAIFESSGGPDCAQAGGGTIALADFGENGQNEILTPMPDPPDPAEPFPCSPEEEAGGTAGDDLR